MEKEKPVEITPSEYDAAAVEMLSKYRYGDGVTFAMILFATADMRDILFDDDKRRKAVREMEGLRK